MTIRITTAPAKEDKREKLPSSASHSSASASSAARSVLSSLPTAPPGAFSRPITAPASSKVATAKAAAKKTLEKTQIGFPPVTWRQFALLHNATLIRFSSFDRGIQVLNSMIVYQEYLTFLLKNGYFFTLAGDPKTAKALHTSLDDSRDIFREYLTPIIGQYDDATFKAAVTKIFQKINAQLTKNKYAYWPVAFTAKTGGHALNCKATQDATHTTLYLLNSGLGAEGHPELHVTHTSYQHSTSFYPVRMTNAEWQDHGEMLLSYMMHYTWEAPEIDDFAVPYIGEEVYDLFLSMGELRPELIALNADKFQSNQQTVGDCGDRVAKNQIVDFLAFHTTLSSEDRDLLFLNIEFASILAAYHTYLAQIKTKREEYPGQLEHYRLLLEDAARLFINRLMIAKRNLKEHLSIEQYTHAIEVLAIILEESQAPAVPVSLPALQPKTRLPIDFDAVEHPTISPHNMPAPWSKVDVEKYLKNEIVLIPKFNPLTFKSDFKKWVSLQSKNWYSIYSSLKMLPIPQWEQPQDPWNQIPLADIPEIADLFLQLGCSKSLHSQDRPAHLLCMTIMYTIIDKLARLNNSITKLKNFACPSSFLTEDHYLFFLNPQDESLYAAIRAYFINSQTAAAGVVIFPLQKDIDVAQILADKNRQVKTPATHHLAFLSQFADQAPRSADDFVSLWLSQKIPSTINVLYHFAEVIDQIYKNYMLLRIKPLAFVRNGDGSLSMSHTEPLQFQDSSSRMHQLFLQFQNSTTNEIRAVRFDAQSEEDLLVVMHYPHLKVGQILTWIKGHYHALHVKIIKETLQRALFSVGVLRDFLKEVPNAIEEFRTTVNNGLKVYRNQRDVESIANMIDIAVTFEAFVADETAKPIDEAVLSQYKKRLNAIITHCEGMVTDEECTHYIRALISLVRLETLRKEQSAPYFIDLYTKLFLLQTYHFDADTKDNTIIIHYHKLQCFLDSCGAAKNQIFSQLCSGIVHNLLQENGPKGEILWDFTTPGCAIGRGLTLDFFTAHMFNSEVGSSYLWRATPKKYEDYSLNRLYAGSTNPLWYISHTRHFMSLDGKWVTNGWDKLIKRGEEEVHFPEATRKNSYFFNYFLGASFTMLPKKPGEKTTTVLVHQQKIPYCRIDFTTHGTQLTRLNPQGKEVGKFVNLKSLSPLHPLHAYTLAFAPHERLLCVVDAHSEEILELEFQHLKLKFTKTATGLESREYPGYFFRPNLKLGALGPCPAKAPLILQNAQGKIKLILQMPEEESRLLGDAKKKEKENHLPQSFIYDVESLNAPIIGKTLSEQLFFIYFLKANGHYIRAIEELEKIKEGVAFDLYTFRSVIGAFLKLRDFSAPSLAFNMQLLFFLCDRFSSIPSDLRYTARCDLQTMAYGWYVDYLKAMGDEYIGGIPKEYQIDEVQERRILATLSRENTTKLLPRMLQLRIEFYKNASCSAKVVFTPHPVSVAPRGYRSLVPPPNLASLTLHSNDFPYGKPYKGEKSRAVLKYTNRLTAKHLHEHFPDFYEQAKKAPPFAGYKKVATPFDLTLLTILKISAPEKDDPHSNYQKLASLLFYVRHFPQEFAALSLSKAQTGAQNVATFNAIVAKAIALGSHAKYPQFKRDVLEPTAPFELTKTVVVAIPLNVPTVALPKPLALEITKQPFLPLSKRLFKESSQTPLEAAFIFDPYFPKTTPFEKELLEKYRLAQANLAKQKTTSRDLLPNERASVVADLKTLEQQYTVELNAVQNRLKASLNDPFTAFGIDDFEKMRAFQMAMHAHQSYPLTAEIIMRKCLLTQDATFLQKERPMLTTAHMQEIFLAAAHYYHLRVLQQQSREAIALLNQLVIDPTDVALQHELFTILNYEFLYDPVKFPEISYFKVKGGKLPRPDQFKTYEWVCEGIAKNENRLFQLPAGGGKTSYLVPLLALHAKRYPVVPVVFATQAIYGVEKRNLGETLRQLGEELATLEIAIDKELLLEDLKMIYHDLKSYVDRRKTLIITPTTYYALRLAYFVAADNVQDVKRAEMLKLILDLFKKEGLQLLDESHRNLNPATQSIYGTGDFVRIDLEERLLIFELMKPLLGMKKVLSEPAAAMMNAFKFTSELQVAPTAAELSIIQKGLAEHIATYLLKQLSTQKQIPFIDFWSDKKAKAPPVLANLSPKDQQLVIMTRYWIVDILPQIFQLRTDFDHVLSIENGAIETPAYHRTPTHAQFKNVYLTASLTIKGMWQRGLAEFQVERLVSLLQKLDAQEMEVAVDIEQTPSLTRFQNWVKTLEPKVTLRSINIKDQDEMRRLAAHLKMCPEAMECYLQAEVLNQIGACAEQLSLSPTHLMNGFKCSILFSATPLPPLAYPRSLKACRFDEHFEAQTIATGCLAVNQHFLFTKTPQAFFASMLAQKQTFEKTQVLINAGGVWPGYKNRELAILWLSASSLDGVFYFEDGDGDNLSALMKVRGEFITIRLQRGTNHLKAELADHGFDWNRLKIGTYFDPPHAESANVLQKPDITAVIFASEELTLSHAIQSMNRLRGFNQPHMKQHLIWALPPLLRDKICGKNRLFSAEAFFSWCLKNEARTQKSSLVSAAFQEIGYAIEQLCFEGGVDTTVAIQRYRAGFRERVTMQQTAPHSLMDFAQSCYKRFGYATAFEAHIELQKQLAEILTQTKAKVTKMVMPTNGSGAGQMHRKCVVREVSQRHQVSRIATEGRSAEPVTRGKKVSNGDYPTTLTVANSARTVYKIPHLTDQVFVDSNQIKTAKVKGKSLDTDLLKTFDFILITLYQGKIYAEILSNDSAADVYHELRNCRNAAAGIRHQAFLIRTNGALYQCGKGALKPTEAAIQTVLQSPWMHDLLADAALLNGKHPLADARMKTRVARWPDFPLVLQRIYKAFPHGANLSTETLHSYIATLQDPLEGLTINFNA